MKNLKLFPKTFLYITGLMLVIALIAHALIYFFMPVVYTNQKRDALEKNTGALVQLLESLPEEEYESAIREFRKGKDMMAALSFFSSEGLYISQFFADESDADITEGGEYEISRGSGGVTSQSYADLLTGDSLSNERTFAGKGNTAYTLTAYLPLEPVREASSAVLALLPITLIVCVALSAIFALIYSKAITTPIRRLSSAAHRMERLDRAAVCPVTGSDEIGTLAEDLNSLYSHLLMTIDRLECEISKVRESEQSKVDFLRTASHELKTPITAISGMLEGMIHHVGRYKDRNAYLRECKKRIDELGDMLKEILEASKLDMYAGIKQTKTVDLDLLLNTVIEPYRFIAKAKNTNLVYIKDGSFSAELPESLFAKAVANVVSNAVNYTDGGKSVHVYFHFNSIIIENECVPVHKDVLAHLAEPFYRPDFDHNHDTGGNGLGLYITDKILAACGIEYTFEPMKSKEGMRFTIKL